MPNKSEIEKMAKGLCALALISLAGCGDSRATEERGQGPEMVRVEFYPQPNLREGRVFKVEDQYGCQWWMTAHQKFDSTWPVLGDDGEPICPPGAPKPEKAYDYVPKVQPAPPSLQDQS